MLNRPFNPGRGANQQVTAAVASAEVAIKGIAKSVRVCNSGTVLAHVRLSKGGEAATTADTPVLPGTCVILFKGEEIDAISYIRNGAGDTTLQIQTGEDGI